MGLDQPPDHPERKPMIAGMMAARRGLPLAASGGSLRDCPTCTEMVVVPAGTFMMGSPEDEDGRGSNEGPQHEVAIPRHFAMSRTEITHAQYAEFMKTSGHVPKNGVCRQDKPGHRNKGPEPDDPAVCISWHDANAYVKWLGGRTGQTHRLPSEAEWEYAARGGTTTRYWWGDHIGSNLANCNNCGSQWDGDMPAPVASFGVNHFGLYDMLGNVWEWTYDCRFKMDYGRYSDEAPVDGSPWLKGDCTRRAIRSGYYDSGIDNIRAAKRQTRTGHNRYKFLGLRVVRAFEALK